MSKLNNKIAVVTGGNSGIGLATAKRFAAEGAKVIITGRRKEAIDEAVASIGGGASGIVADAAELADQLSCGTIAARRRVWRWEQK